MKEKYNFIVVCGDNDIYDIAYRDLDNTDDAYFDNHFPKNRLLKLAYSFSYSDRVNRILRHTGKTWWVRLRAAYYKSKAKHFRDGSKKVCFLLFSDCLSLESYGFSQELRRRFPQCRIVYYFQDIVARDERKRRFLQENRSLSDLVLSFDRNDADTYGLAFHNIPYSSVRIAGENEYDVGFVGQAKDRLDEILEAYAYLQSAGLKCYIYIVDADEKKRKYENEIIYGPPVKYADYLQRISKCKCILEIMQHGGNGNTIRVNEAIALNKLLISNNTDLPRNELFYPAYMQAYQNVNEIDVNQVLRTERVAYPEALRSGMSPVQFLDDIEKML